jgi:peptide/nickel transport system substrate-binding protein
VVMQRLFLRLASAIAVLVAAHAPRASGDDEDGGGSGGGADRESGQAVRQGGQATFAYGSFPDFLDPALAYTVDAWLALTTTNLPLLTYPRVEGPEATQLIPALAEAMPEVADGGRTYRFRLRDGLRYSDGTPVRAGDFEHTIKRVINLESGGASFYSDTIAGADEYLERRRARGDISGIETNDETREITIRLDEPRGDFPNILAMDFAGLVPGDTPFENQTRNPPPGVGPFKITEVDGTRSFVLEKNPNYQPIEGVPAAQLDRITVRVQKNQTRSVQDTLDNRIDWVNDPAPGDALRTFRQRASDRYEQHVTNSTYYYFLNHRVEPFDDVRVRQAVNFAIDKRAIARLYGGLLQPSCNFLPPGMQGYREMEPCPYGDPMEVPNVERARQLIREAGAEGERVKVYGNDEEPTRSVTEYLADVLNQIGLRARPQIVEGSVYFGTMGNQRTEAQAGYASWFQDYPHPQNFMFLVAGSSIQPTNTVNYGFVDDPQLNQALDRLLAQPLEQAAPGYAQADRRVVEQGHVAAYGHRLIPTITSNRIAFDRLRFHPVMLEDFTSFALVEGQQ